ncbi:hypothetical protein BASA50_009995 [Batrachochytrium salamandrivorans]|uniref:RNA-directed DNA polymerase n=1 Tax=Batrachochytrium salamandrivorans TaxID=1357716 RepID=A0ABQ8F2U4_9FUNG|nr:hypothetical protein BASA50_009995 [Batrachochytrium salamandrivorans]
MPIGKKRIRSINNSDNLLTLSIHSLSSRNKLLLPGTLRLGSISYVNTLFVDCGADDLFMDSKLAQDLKFPLVKLPNPIKLRLADGDSSSVITHRTVPLQLHIGNHVETVSFYVTSLCHATSKSEEDVPKEILSEFAGVFEKDLADVLPPHRNFDCAIDLKPLSEPSYGKIYQLTREEDTVMQDWIKENLKKGYIRNSSSPHGAPCFFVKQKDKLRLCMDYRGLNKNTIKDRNPIPLISEMLRTLSSGKIFTTLDLRGAYNLLRIKDGDEQKTSFITKYGQFEFLVMPFGLANAPAQFQRMMNSLFQDMISKFVLVYLDDIVIYSDNLKDHKTHVRSVLRILSDNRLFCKPEKCHFYQTEIRKAILDLKNAFSVGDFLAHPDDSRPFILETDASDFAISGILSQYDDQDSLRPVAFYSRQMNDAERNYEIYDKELLAVVDSFKHWRHFLQGGLHPIMVLCDHKNLEYFMTTKKLTRRQARWSLELSEYDFSITHRPGKLNGRADPLSRRHDYKVDDESQNFKRLLDPQRVIDIQSIVADMDLHILVYSEVLKTVFVQELDWPLIVADFLAGEENIWLPDIPEDLLEKCKKELKHFRYRDDTFVRILEDGKSTAAYMPSHQRETCIKNK